MSESKTNIAKPCLVFVGNTGRGKSALCNSFIGEDKFESDLAFGRLTVKMSIHETQIYRVCDVPGLADVIDVEGNKKEIEKALGLEGKYIVVFVIQETNGRILAEDVITMNSILDSMTNKENVAIITNQISPQSMNFIERNESRFWDQIKGLKIPSSRRFLIKRYDNLKEFKTISREIIQSLLDEIVPSEIKDFKGIEITNEKFREEMERMKKEFETQQKNLTIRIKRMEEERERKTIEEQNRILKLRQKAFKKLKDDFYEEQKRIVRDESRCIICEPFSGEYICAFGKDLILRRTCPTIWKFENIGSSYFISTFDNNKQRYWVCDQLISTKVRTTSVLKRSKKGLNFILKYPKEGEVVKIFNVREKGFLYINSDRKFYFERNKFTTFKIEITNFKEIPFPYKFSNIDNEGNLIQFETKK